MKKSIYTLKYIPNQRRFVPIRGSVSNISNCAVYDEINKWGEIPLRQACIAAEVLTLAISKDDHLAGWKIRKCKECGMYFWDDEAERDWFISKGLNLPKRCHICRNKKKGM